MVGRVTLHVPIFISMSVELLGDVFLVRVAQARVIGGFNINWLVLGEIRNNGNVLARK